MIVCITYVAGDDFAVFRPGHHSSNAHGSSLENAPDAGFTVPEGLQGVGKRGYILEADKHHALIDLQGNGGDPVVIVPCPPFLLEAELGGKLFMTSAALDRVQDSAAQDTVF